MFIRCLIIFIALFGVSSLNAKTVNRTEDLDNDQPALLLKSDNDAFTPPDNELSDVSSPTPTPQNGGNGADYSDYAFTTSTISTVSQLEENLIDTQIDDNGKSSPSGSSTPATCQSCRTDGKLPGFDFEIRDSSIFVMWDAIDKSPECQYKYSTTIAELPEFQRYENTTGTNFTVNDFCIQSEWHLNVSTTDACDLFKRNTSIYTIPTSPNDIKMKYNISITPDANNMSFGVLIEPSNLLASCENTFNITITPLDEDAVDVNNSTEPNFTFDKAVPCQKYNVTTRMKILDYVWTASRELVMPPIAPKFNASVDKVGPYSAFLRLHLPLKQKFQCDIQQFNLTCTSDKTNFSKNFLIQQRLEEYDIKNLMARTMYDCRINLITEDNIVSDFNITISTIPNEPSPVRNLTATNLTTNSITFLWIKPEFIPLPLTSYKLQLHGVPRYVLPKYCKHEDYDKTWEDIYPEQNHLTFTKEIGRLPGNYEWNATVSAKTDNYGMSTDVLMHTNARNPSRLENIIYDIQVPEKNQPKLYFRWKFPCDANANPSDIDFKFEIFGQGGSIHNETIDQNVNADDDLENLTMDLNINPSTNYTFRIFLENKIENLLSEPYEITFSSPLGNTSQPSNVTISTSNNYLFLNWEEPSEIFGNLLGYKVTFITKGPKYHDECDNFNPGMNNEKTEKTNQTEIKFEIQSYYEYEIRIQAITSEKPGAEYKDGYLTDGYASSPVRELNTTVLDSRVDCAAKISFHSPCYMNGVFQTYVIFLYGERGDEIMQTNTTQTSYTLHGKFLKPMTSYRVEVRVRNDFGLSTDVQDVFTTSTCGIPELSVNLTAEMVITKQGATDMEIVVRKDYFEQTHGDVRYYAILLGFASKWENGPGSGPWSGTCPGEHYWNDEGRKYQATKCNTELKDAQFSEIKYLLGDDPNCANSGGEEFCNGPLQPDTKYMMVIRGFTADGYRDSNVLAFQTLDDYAKTKDVVLIIGITSGVLVVLVLIGLGCLYWRRRPRKESLEDRTKEENILLLPGPVKIEEFIEFYASRKLFLLDEFESLAEIGANMERSIAQRPENRKKNRYINILPYDQTIVDLEYCGEEGYINASYIKGYSGKVEYIATQGPLETTTADFWTMVLQEDCRVIAMVAQFQEQNKVKCHRYFPENRGQLELQTEKDDEITLRCSYEVSYGYYMERQIIVQTKEKQHTVVHLQYLNWPDFGCPDGTANMLQFTMLLRKHMYETDSKAVIHCSAGVGRTGTLIAVDILLQTIRDGKDINIYDTVLALRKQRQKMVQSETQYYYIYKCISDAITNPVKLAESKNNEPIYENFEKVIEMKVLSSDNNNLNNRNKPSIIDSNHQNAPNMLNDQNDETNQQTAISIVDIVDRIDTDIIALQDSVDETNATELNQIDSI